MKAIDASGYVARPNELLTHLIHAYVLALRRTSIGVRCKDGVVLAVEKLLISPMLVEGSSRRIAHLETHLGAVSTSAATSHYVPRHPLGYRIVHCRLYPDGILMLAS